MSKIMVVEDDASLREIYSIRITAEGYDVVSAGDGEEALAVAVREKPDLILSDVMMPKISGFDMLDILRSTPETHDIKVVMMTALSADDQRQRGERLGADRYLVKSQVGIEDVVNTIHEVLGDREPVATPATSASNFAQEPVAAAPTSTSAPENMPAMAPTPEPVAAAPAVVSTQEVAPAVGPAPEAAPVTPNANPAPEAAPVTPNANLAPEAAPVTPNANPAPEATPVTPAAVNPSQSFEANPYDRQSINPAQ